MEHFAGLVKAHPEGEAVLASLGNAERWPVDTPGGRFYAEWDSQAPVTREGQLIFFFQFLEVGQRWREFMRDCPLRYFGNRGSGAHNVLGTIFLSVLCGHWRYAHINSVRGDRVNPPLLGMEHTVSEDAVRGALKRMDEQASLSWIGQQIRHSIEAALILPWILDIDTTVKPLYGRQQGAELGYNPHKPGRPSHVYHSYFVANLRISLGVDVRPGNEHAAAQGMPGLWRMLDQLPRERWPSFVRGDCGYGNEKVMVEFEMRQLPYLFKLRHTPKVKNLIRAVLSHGKGWKEAGAGWQAAEASLLLSGWSRTRRVILVREAPAVAPVGAQARRRRDPFALPGTQSQNWLQINAAPWSGRIAVLVTALDERAYPTESMPRLYRERADCENGYDELKNQWGWNGYTTQKLAPSRIMANLVALFYNWWNLYVRFYDELHHREAISSRPALMQGVARQVHSGGQSTVKISLVHEYRDDIATLVSLTSRQLQRFSRITERWTAREKWNLLLTRLLRRWLGGKWLPGLPPEAKLLLSG